MKLYTKTGDRGTTAMLSGNRIKKSDDRIELIGTIDELNSHLGLVKAVSLWKMKEDIGKIQRDLMTIMSIISDQGKNRFQLPEERIHWLEGEIDRVESLFPRKKEFVLYGGCELSARLDVARAVARRAERRFVKLEYLSTVFADEMKYMNRLADYLYIQARYQDYLVETEEKEKDDNPSDSRKEAEMIEKLVLEALKNYGKVL